MSILSQQIMMSKAVANGRTVVGQAGDNWVTNNVTTSQLRESEVNSDLVSGYWGGGESLGAGRAPHMYPDNRTCLNAENGVLAFPGRGVNNEIIRDSKTAGAIG